MRPSPSHARQERPTREAYATRRLTFESNGRTCVGTLYTPAGSGTPPVVVLAPGFAAERSFGVPAVAERFAAAGYAAFTFDYRGFGESEPMNGPKRNLVLPTRQLADFEAAIERVTDLETVDSDRLGLWGTSLSGGHVISIAADRADVSAAIVQVPFVDGRAIARSQGPKYIGRALAAGLLDRVGGAFGRPHRVRVYGDPDQFAILADPEAKQAYLDLIPRESTWANRTRARAVLALARYRPVTAAHAIRAPTMVVAGIEDRVVPLESVARLVDRIADVSFLSRRMGHFEVYDGAFDETVRQELAFLDGVL